MVCRRCTPITNPLRPASRRNRVMDERRFWHLVGISWTTSQITALRKADRAAFLDAARRQCVSQARPGRQCACRTCNPFGAIDLTAIDSAFRLLVDVQWLPADRAALTAAADAGMPSTQDGA